MHISHLSVRRPIATSMLLVAACLLGAVSLARLDVALLPDTRAEQLGVWVGYPDASAPEIEEAVARPVEEALMTVRGVVGVSSRLVTGGARFTVRLYPGTDPEVASLSLRERLDAVRWSLPEGVERPLLLGSGELDTPVMVLALAADDLRVAADWAADVLKPRLERAAGVARAQVTGVPKREVRVTLDPGQLQATGVTVAEVSRAIELANVSVPGGILRRRGIRYALHVESELTRAEDIGQVMVRAGDRPVRVTDVGTVEDGFEDTRGFSRLDGRPAVGVLVYREAGANLVDMAQRVRQVLQGLAGAAHGIEVAVITDPSPFLRQSISGVTQAVWFGGLLSFTSLLVFLRDYRSPLFLLVTLPTSVVVTFAILHLTGISLNLMSLGGLALGIGMLVDNSIICLENIDRLRATGLPRARAAAQAAQEVSLPMLASTLTTLAVFIPLAWVPGALGTMLKDQAIAVSASLLTSLVVAMTLVPVLASRLSPTAAAQPRMPFYREYHRALVWCLDHSRLTLWASVGLAAASAVVLLLLPREILPELDTENIELALRLSPGSDLQVTDAAAAQLESWLRQRPEVERVFANVGASGTLDPSDPLQQPHAATVRVLLRAGATRQRAQLVRQALGLFARRPGWSIELLPDRLELADLLDSHLARLTCEITAADPALAEGSARAVLQRAQAMLGGAGGTLRLAGAEGEPRFSLELDPEALWRQGLAQDEVVAALLARGSGLQATQLRRFDEEDPVVLRTTDQGEVAEGTIMVGGRSYPVRALVRVTPELAPAVLLRENQARVATLVWDGPMRRAENARRTVEAALAQTAMPPGASWRFGGAYQQMHRTLQALLRAFLLSCGLVLLILAAQFESIRLPLVIFCDVPLSLVGIAAALLVLGQSLNAMSGIGIVVLVGVVVNDTILKVDTTRRLQDEGWRLRDAILEAGHRRYRPIWMTNLTTILGLVPMFFGRGAALRAPMAAAIIGGMLFSTMLTLLVMPVLYQQVEGWRRRGAPVGAKAPTPGGASATATPALEAQP